MNRNALFLSCLLLAPALAGAQASGDPKASVCGPAVHHSTQRMPGPSPLEARPPKEQALVYVVRPTIAGSWTQSKLSIDRQWVGVNQAHTYFLAAVAPGAHELCSQTENGSRLTVTLESGKTYFFQQHIRAGAWRAQNDLSQLTEAEGRAAVKKCKRMIFWAKGTPKPAA